MIRTESAVMQVTPVEGLHFLYVSAGRGQELCERLAAHGITGVFLRSPSLSFDRLELRGQLDDAAIQTVLDGWE